VLHRRVRSIRPWLLRPPPAFHIAALPPEGAPSRRPWTGVPPTRDSVSLVPGNRLNPRDAREESYSVEGFCQMSTKGRERTSERHGPARNSYRRSDLQRRSAGPGLLQVQGT